MRKYMFTGVKQLSMTEEPTPSCPIDGVLVAATGSVVNTGTEIRIYRGTGIDFEPEKLPKPAGYCIVGEAVQIGPKATAVREGDRVFAWAPYADYAAVGANDFIRIPNGICDEWAAFTDLLDIGLYGIRLAETTPGEYLAVIGQGIIGQATLACARALGFRTIAIEFDPHRRAISERMGADLVLDPDQPDFMERINVFTRGEGVDTVVEVASTWSAIRTGYDMVRRGGKVVVPARHLDVPDWSPVGYPYQRREISLKTSWSYWHFAGFQSFPTDVCRWSRRRNFELLWDLMASGRLDIDPMITHRFDFADLADVYARLDAGERDLVGIYVQF